jgi:hypothetical protein
MVLVVVWLRNDWADRPHYRLLKSIDMRARLNSECSWQCCRHPQPISGLTARPAACSQVCKIHRHAESIDPMTISLKSLVGGALALAAAVFSLSTTTLAQEPDSTSAVPGVLPAFIVAGLPDPKGKVPTFNGVPGAGVTNLDIAEPLTILTHGQKYVYLVSFEDYDVTGTYEVEYELTQTVGTTTKTLQSGTIVKGKSFTPDTVWAWAIEGPAIPDSPGLSTLEGTIKYGTDYGTGATVKTTVLIK